MLTCRNATRLMSENQDRKLTLAERLSLQMHLLFCAGCRNFDAQMRALRRLLRGYARGENEPGESPDAKHGGN
ncbi:putative uncharacterized protein [Burkholderiales bacterium GJ-E10]|nr:putative uncharacterized protein [Burkholderiales bacterium GJ-E10]